MERPPQQGPAAPPAEQPQINGPLCQIATDDVHFGFITSVRPPREIT
jgi:hypothetical protein